MLKKLLLATALTAMTAGAAFTPSAADAACAYENEVPLKSLTAGFEAWKAVTDAMAECGNFQAELDQEFRTKQPAAFAANPALYDMGGVANGTLVPLLNDDTIRPLNDLVEKHGQHLGKNQLITIDGQIMAIAMMVNTQHLMYRADILDELGLEVPTTWDEVLATAEAIEAAGVVEHPLGATMASGWNIAQDFINLYLGFGGSFVDEAKMPTLNNEAGVQTLELMKAMTAYMDPEFLVSDSTFVQKQFQQGDIALANFWASRAGAMDNEAESSVVGLVEFAAAPAVAEGLPPATTIWWDGMVIAKNITDEEAEAAFLLMMEGLDTEMVEGANDAAVWLVEGYEPTRLADGTIASMQGGAPPYPASTEMGLLHTAIGNNVTDYLTGSKTAEETLQDIEAEYLTAARQAGFIQ